MKSSEFVQKVKSVATDFKTLYVMGCWGAPLNEKNKTRYTTNNSYNQKEERKKMIMEASDDTFGFDCVCFVKGIMWGWNGDKDHIRGGAVYQSNGVPDTTIDRFLKECSDVSADFSSIEKGEFLYMDGHCGVYIGDGLAVECTPKWENKVQITAVGNIGKVDGYNTRTWEKHGKLSFIDYTPDIDDTPVQEDEISNSMPEEETEVEEMLYNIQITKNFSKGMTGDEVKKLQIRVAQISPEYESEMKSHSFSNGQFDGSFGPSMVKTIKKLQEEAGLTVTGSVDEATRELLNGSVLTLNKKIADVKKILE